MAKFVFHRVKLCKVLYDLGPEYPHRDGIEQQFLPHSQYGSLFLSRSPQSPLTYGMHEDVSSSIDEDAQAVRLERVASQTLSIHAFLQLPNEQLVESAPAVRLLIQAQLVSAPHVAYDEPHVELALLGLLGLDHYPLRKAPCTRLVAELPIRPYGKV